MNPYFLSLFTAATVALANSVHAAVILSPTTFVSNSLDRTTTNTTRTIDRSGLSSPFISGTTDYATYISSLTNP
ncbi:MAG: hypothetical protein HC845_11065 [Akkermansiaceae bacterium]|nr:hypothetical protein [Akkermansiaceae bacterium]